MRLNGKVLIVTGAARGIGKACATAAAREGAKVVVADRDVEAGEATVAALKAQGGDASFVPVDVSIPAQVETMIRRSVAEFGRLDCLIGNAGMGGRKFGDGPVADCSLDAWNAVLSVNLTGTFLSCKYAIPELIKTRGSIVTMSSILGMVGTPGIFDTHAYATSKAAIIGLTRQIAVHYARDGVRANAIAPGLIDTDMARRSKSDPELLAQLSQLQPLSPLGDVEDVAKAAVYLASDDAKFVTGTVLAVDGGWSAQ